MPALSDSELQTIGAGDDSSRTHYVLLEISNMLKLLNGNCLFVKGLRTLYYT